MRRPDRGGRRDWRDRIGKDKVDLQAVSAVRHAAEIRIPIMIAHGKKDHRVPVSQSVRLHEALEKAGRVHEYVLYPEEGHGFVRRATETGFREAVRERDEPYGDHGLEGFGLDQ